MSQHQLLKYEQSKRGGLRKGQSCVALCRAVANAVPTRQYDMFFDGLYQRSYEVTHSGHDLPSPRLRQDRAVARNDPLAGQTSPLRSRDSVRQEDHEAQSE